MMTRLLVLMIFSSLTGVLPAQGDFEKGVSYYKQGQFAKAIAEFEEIVKAHPDYEPGYRVLGDSYLKIRNYDRAIAAFQKAIGLKGENFVSHYGLAVAYYNTGRYRDAVATLLKGERYARSPRERYDLLHTRGAAYFNLDKFSEAIPDLEKAVSIQRGVAEDVLQLGIAHFRAGNYSEAEKYLRQALTLKPDAAEAERYLAQLNYQAAFEAIEGKNYRKASEILKNYVAQHPQDGDAWFNLGLTQLFADNLKAAEEAFLKSTQLAPGNWEAFDRLGFIYEKGKQYQKSLQYYQKALELHRETRIQDSVERLQERIRRQSS